MNGSMYLRTLGMIMGSAGMWFFFHMLHDKGMNGTMKRHVIRVPRWLGLLCGRPLPDNKVELAAMLGQLGTFLAFLLWGLGLLLNLDIWSLVTLCAGTLGASVIVCFATRVTISVIKRGEKGNNTGDQ